MTDRLNSLIGRGLAITRWARHPIVRNCAREGCRWLNIARAARRDGLPTTGDIALKVALEHFRQASRASAAFSRV